MEDSMANRILTELREFRNENNKRWKENQQLWEENNQRWEENDHKLEEINKRMDGMNERMDGMKERIVDIEEGRKKDRRDMLVILDTMEKSISNQLVEMKEYFDTKFDKVFSAQRLNDMENEQFKKLLCAHEKRLNFYKARLNYLEEWKQQFDMGEYTAV